MSFRPPSLQKPYTLCSSFDPALNLPVVPELAEDASAEDKAAAAEIAKERARLYEVACDTGNWSAITKPGESPTPFECKPIHGPKAVWLVGEINRKELTQAEVCQLAFRLGVRKIGIDGIKLEDEVIDGHCVLTKESLEQIYSIGRDVGDATLGPSIVIEIGSLILARAVQGVPPKS